MQIRTYIDSGALIAIDGFDSIYLYYKTQIKEGTTLARSWVKGVNLGGVDLEQALFAEEIQEEKIEIAQKAAEKIKAAVDAANKKIEEEKEKERIAKEAAEKQMLEA